MKKIHKAVVLSLIMSLLVGTVAMAKENDTYKAVKVNDVVLDSDGCKAVVISVYSNGDYVTLKQQYSAYKKTSCKHTAIVTYGKPKARSKDTSVRNATYCYRWNETYAARCAKCNQRGFEVTKCGDNIKHKYGLFSKKCSQCGYKKK